MIKYVYKYNPLMTTDPCWVEEHDSSPLVMATITPLDLEILHTLLAEGKVVKTSPEASIVECYQPYSQWVDQLEKEAVLLQQHHRQSRQLVKIKVFCDKYGCYRYSYADDESVSNPILHVDIVASPAFELDSIPDMANPETRYYSVQARYLPALYDDRVYAIVMQIWEEMEKKFAEYDKRPRMLGSVSW